MLISSVGNFGKKWRVNRTITFQKFKFYNNYVTINPITTRWGTWLKTAFYYVDNFEAICKFIDKLENKSKAIKDAKILCKSSLVKSQLQNMNPFRFILEKIKLFQTSNLSIQQQMDLLNDTKKNLKNVEYAFQKMAKYLKKNPDLLKFTSETNSPEFKRKTKFAPLVSVEVERSFSKYKSLLSEKRINLTENNIEKFIVIQFNDFL